MSSPHLSNANYLLRWKCLWYVECYILSMIITSKGALDTCLSGPWFDNTRWTSSRKEGLLSRHIYFNPFAVFEAKLYWYAVVTATQTILSKIPPNDRYDNFGWFYMTNCWFSVEFRSKLTYVWEQYFFHYISEGGFIYLVMADDSAERFVGLISRNPWSLIVSLPGGWHLHF